MFNRDGSPVSSLSRHRNGVILSPQAKNLVNAACGGDASFLSMTLVHGRGTEPTGELAESRRPRIPTTKDETPRASK